MKLLKRIITISILLISFSAYSSTFMKLCKDQDSSWEILDSIEAIKKVLKTTDCNKTYNKLLTITELSLKNTDFYSLVLLAEFTQLELLNIDNTFIEDISPISGLLKLKALDLSNLDLSRTEDLTALQSMDQLEELYLFWNDILSINGVENLKSLKKLTVTHNESITDISNIKELVNIEYLSLTNNNIEDISPLSKLQKLTKIYLQGNNIGKNIKQCPYGTNVTSQIDIFCRGYLTLDF